MLSFTSSDSVLEAGFAWAKEKALSYARHAADSNPSSAVYAYTLGLALEATGNTDAAIAAFISVITGCIPVCF